MNWTIPILVLYLIFLESILSIDNAAVLGAMVVSLPGTLPVPWPGFLRRIGRLLDPLLGKQRLAALRVGLLGAYFGRGLMLVMASFIVQNHWLKLVGAVYLIHLAFENLGMPEEGETEEHVRSISSRSFWMIVLNVEIADLIFSIDNVVAAVALSNKLWVVMLGVAIGILGMRFAAGFFSYAVEREPILKSAAYLLVLNIGIQLIIEEYARVNINDLARFGSSVVILLVCLLYAHFKPLQTIRPVLIWLAQGFANINEVINWAFVPVVALAKLLFRVVRLKKIPFDYSN